VIPKQCQIAIVGGGPGGLAAALAAKKAGAESVVVIERKRRWGRPIQCAGYAPRLLGRTVDFDGAAVRSALNVLELHLDGELLKSAPAPGYILRRDVLERQMAQAATEAGAICLQPARVVEINDGSLVVEAEGGRSTLKAEIIIGADGPRSMTRQAMGLPAPKMAAGLEWELPLAKPNDAAEVHFAAAYGAGYAWIFPHGRAEKTAGVGLALDIDRPGNVKELLRAFVAGMVRQGRLLEAEPSSRIAGPIPVGGPVEKTIVGNKALVGDAAGQTNPLTGAGILHAAACGEMAGRAAARAVQAGDPSLLSAYEEEWRDLLEGFLGRATCGRDGMAGAPAGDFPAEVRRAWRLRK
jgi:digeranylgeranylglycerophospholipid reductase